MRSFIFKAAISACSMLAMFAVSIKRVDAASYTMNKMIEDGIVTNVDILWSDNTRNEEESTLKYGEGARMTELSFTMNPNSLLKDGDTINFGSTVYSGAMRGGWGPEISQTKVNGVGTIQKSSVTLEGYDKNATTEINIKNITSGGSITPQIDADEKRVTYLDYMKKRKKINLILREPTAVFTDPSKVSGFKETMSRGGTPSRIYGQLRPESNRLILSMLLSDGKEAIDSTIPSSDRDYIVVSKLNKHDNMLENEYIMPNNGNYSGVTVGPDGKSIVTGGTVIGMTVGGIIKREWPNGTSIQTVIDNIEPMTIGKFLDSEGNHISVINFGRYGTSNSPLEKNSGSIYYNSMLSTPWAVTKSKATEIQNLFNDTNNALGGGFITMNLRHNVALADSSRKTTGTGEWMTSYDNFQKKHTWSMTTNPSITDTKGQSTVKFHFRSVSGENLSPVVTQYGWGADKPNASKYTYTAPIMMGDKYQLIGANTVTGDFPSNEGSKDIVFVYRELPPTETSIKYQYYDSKLKRNVALGGLIVDLVDSSGVVKGRYITDDNGNLSEDGNINTKEFVPIERGRYTARVIGGIGSLNESYSGFKDISIQAIADKINLVSDGDLIERTWNLNLTIDDNSNQDGKRPASTSTDVVARRSSGERIYESQFNKDNGHEVTIKDYKYNAKTKKANEVTFDFPSIDEKSGYTIERKSNDSTHNVTATRPIEKKDIHVSVTWNDNDDAMLQRPKGVFVNLLKNGNIVDEREVSGESPILFNVDKNEAGREIIYTVNVKTPSGYIENIDGYNIILTHKGGGAARLTPTGSAYLSLLVVLSSALGVSTVIIRRK